MEGLPLLPLSTAPRLCWGVHACTLARSPPAPRASCALRSLTGALARWCVWSSCLHAITASTLPSLAPSTRSHSRSWCVYARARIRLPLPAFCCPAFAGPLPARPAHPVPPQHPTRPSQPFPPPCPPHKWCSSTSTRARRTPPPPPVPPPPPGGVPPPNAHTARAPSLQRAVLGARGGANGAPAAGRLPSRLYASCGVCVCGGGHGHAGCCVCGARTTLALALGGRPWTPSPPSPLPSSAPHIRARRIFCGAIFTHPPTHPPAHPPPPLPAPHPPPPSGVAATCAK